jgi:hypothetical protein
VPEFERKALPFQLKADQEGKFTAVFATLNVIDHDGDITVPGAFKDGAEVVVGSWGHKSYDLPVGKGVIRATQNEATVEGEFFLDTQPGKDTYQTVKNLGSLGEWSYIFQVTKQSFGTQDNRPVRLLEGLQVYSVDPVLAGAGIDTRTTSIKSLTRDLPFLEHSEEISELLEEYVGRVKERSAIRAKEGRMMSSANMERLMRIAESLKGASGELEQLMQDSAPKTNELVREFLRFQRYQMGRSA